ncbi:hypothetical protein LCGC14_3169550 [marine sediment metagenome]|uniref:Uncharacterized protein n=1 Tax=marine sediment metagenome TaxID=412755 RepID=A0A0F8VE17_9ZZZZ
MVLTIDKLNLQISELGKMIDAIKDNLGNDIIKYIAQQQGKTTQLNAQISMIRIQIGELITEKQKEKEKRFLFGRYQKKPKEK